jgi:hypothetical protein
MKRTQLYFDEEVWEMLRVRARRDRTTISDLVRSAVRERYIGNGSERKEAMLAVVGLWKNRTDLPETRTYLRRLREDGRLIDIGECCRS